MWGCDMKGYSHKCFRQPTDSPAKQEEHGDVPSYQLWYVAKRTNVVKQLTVWHSSVSGHRKPEMLGWKLRTVNFIQHAQGTDTSTIKDA